VLTQAERRHVERRDGQNQKAASVAAFRAYIPVFGHEVNENVGHKEGPMGPNQPGFSARRTASWGKPKKRIQPAGPTLVTESADTVV
jgi:hypothetical protein